MTRFFSLPVRLALLVGGTMLPLIIFAGAIVYANYLDVSVAVSAPKGLVVPVVRSADAMSFAEIEQAIAGFGKKAKDGTLTADDMKGGTFTISNGGVFGSLLSSPIINPPQSAVLGMHRIEERPVVRDGQIVASIKSMILQPTAFSTVK